MTTFQIILVIEVGILALSALLGAFPRGPRR